MAAAAMISSITADGNAAASGATAAAATPPTTSAPSLPTITRPSRAGSAVQSAVRISGAERSSVFCSENQLSNEPMNISL
jgi:hypothetical protein